MNNQGLWAADPHEYGPGKVHIVDDEDPKKTLCGRYLEAVPGKSIAAVKATCRICLNAVVARPEHRRQAEQWRQDSERRRLEWEQQQEQESEQHERESREWWAKYNAYLSSSDWRRRRQLILKRSGGICEGCMERPATQVHHLSYAHVCNEFLWELRAICDQCHNRAHSGSHTET